jgi:hypothetical protein
MATQSKPKKKIQIDSIVADVQGKAKAAYAKGSAVAGEIGSMAKGNLDAVVSSGKILGTGLKEMGEGSFVEGRHAMDLLAEDLKAVFALGSKNGQAIGKLAS